MKAWIDLCGIHARPYDVGQRPIPDPERLRLPIVAKGKVCQVAACRRPAKWFCQVVVEVPSE